MNIYHYSYYDHHLACCYRIRHVFDSYYRYCNFHDFHRDLKLKTKLKILKICELFKFTIEISSTTHLSTTVITSHWAATTIIESATIEMICFKINLSYLRNLILPIILLLLSNVYSQWLRIIVQHNTSIETDGLFEIQDSLKLDVAESFELIRFLILHQTYILHREFLKDLNNVALNDTLRKISDESEEGRFCREWLLPRLIVESIK